MRTVVGVKLVSANGSFRRARRVHGKSPGGKRPPAIHSRTRRMMSCSISTTCGRKRGGPISERSWKTMNHSEHARTGTSAVGQWIQSATSLRRDGSWTAPAPELVIIDLIAQHNEQSHEQLASDRHFGFGASAPMHEGEVGPLEVGTHARGMRGSLTEGEAKERAALLGDVAQMIFIGRGVQGGGQADVAD